MIVAKSKGNIGIPGLSLLEGADNLSLPIGLGDVMDLPASVIATDTDKKTKYIPN